MIVLSKALCGSLSFTLYFIFLCSILPRPLAVQRPRRVQPAVRNRDHGRRVVPHGRLPEGEQGTALIASTCGTGLEFEGFRGLRDSSRGPSRHYRVWEASRREARPTSHVSVCGEKFEPSVV